MVEIKLIFYPKSWIALFEFNDLAVLFQHLRVQCNHHEQNKSVSLFDWLHMPFANWFKPIIMHCCKGHSRNVTEIRESQIQAQNNTETDPSAHHVHAGLFINPLQTISLYALPI